MNTDPETGNRKQGAEIVESLPPAVDKGVEIENSGKVPAFFLPHWLTFTVHADPSNARQVVIHRLLGLSDVLPDEFFRLGEHGSRGYQKVWIGLDAIRIYFEPSNCSKRYTVEIPGEALEKYVHWKNLVNFFRELDYNGIRWKCSRIDLAFDMDKNSKLSPSDLNSYLRNGGALRCPAERKTIMFISPTFSDISEDVNGSTLYIGSRTSERFVRIYDRRGFTRVELEIKKKKANMIFRELIKADIETRPELAKSFLLDYIDFPDHAVWKEFAAGIIRPARVENNYLAKTLQKTENWIVSSVSPSLAMMARIYGKNVIDDIVQKGDRRISERQFMLIKNANVSQLDAIEEYTAHAPTNKDVIAGILNE